MLSELGTQTVLIGTASLGAAGGMVGVLLMLRRRALLGDVLAHATLPGIALAFLLYAAAGATGERSVWLLAGAAITGIAATFAVQWLSRVTRLGSDVSMAVVLSVFFGFGVMLIGIVQRIPEAGPAGLDAWIYGRAASMRVADLTLIVPISFTVIALVVLLRRDLLLAAFDETFAASVGRPAALIDGILLLLITGAVVAGLPAVGLILIVALFVIPPAAARYWTDRAGVLLAISAVIGAAGAATGTLVSSAMHGAPTGPVIVLVLCALYGISLVFGTSRGMLATRRQHRLHHLHAHPGELRG